MAFVFSYARWISFVELVHSNVAPVDGIVCVLLICLESRSWVFWTWKRKMVMVWHDGYVDWLDCGEYFTMYMYIKSSGCISLIYTIFDCQLHSINLEGKWLSKKALMYSNIIYKSNIRMAICW